MSKIERYCIIISGGFFLLFCANIVMGSLGGLAFLSDITEMLSLFIACLAFIAVILCQENHRKKS